jgi:hypothetical protein
LNNQPAVTGFDKDYPVSEYTRFDSETYSENLQPVSETEYDEVMAEIAAEGFEGYSEWSAQIDCQPSIENFVVRDGKV